MFKAALFDMDGVIVDTEPLHHKAYYQMFDEVNITVPDALYTHHLQDNPLWGFQNN